MKEDRGLRQLLKLFESLDNRIIKLKKISGLACPQGCGLCCLKNDIQATVLEFLPLANSLVQQGRAEEIYEKASLDQSGICVLFNGIPYQSCTEYDNRGLICRLFGFSALHDKHGHAKLSACKILKESASFVKAEKYFKTRKTAPFMEEYYMRLAGIGARFPLEYHPVNKAICLAIEKAIMLNKYRNDRAA